MKFPFKLSFIPLHISRKRTSLALHLKGNFHIFVQKHHNTWHKILITHTLSHKGRGNFPPLMRNVIELRQNVSPFQGSNTIEPYTQGCSPWAILCQPFGLYHMEKNFYPLIQRHCPWWEGLGEGARPFPFTPTCPLPSFDWAFVWAHAEDSRRSQWGGTHCLKFQNLSLTSISFRKYLYECHCKERSDESLSYPAKI